MLETKTGVLGSPEESAGFATLVIPVTGGSGVTNKLATGSAFACLRRIGRPRRRVRNKNKLG